MYTESQTNMCPDTVHSEAALNMQLCATLHLCEHKYIVDGCGKVNRHSTDNDWPHGLMNASLAQIKLSVLMSETWILHANR